MFIYLYILSYTYKHIFIIFIHILMYDNNIKIKNYVSIRRYKKDTKKLSCIKKLKENTQVILFM